MKKSEPLKFTQADRYFSESLSRLFTSSSSAEEVLRGVLNAIHSAFGATFASMYLEDSKIIAGVRANSNGTADPTWTPGFVLVAECGERSVAYSPLLPVGSFQFDKPQQLSESVQGYVDNGPDGPLPKPKNHIMVYLDSRQTVLCRGVIVLGVPLQSKADLPVLLRLSARYLEQVLPIIESVFRRHLQEILGVLIDSGGRVFGHEPRKQFQKIFSEICKLMRVEGGSLFVNGISNASDEVRLVATAPRSVPKDRSAYPKYPTDNPSPTNFVLSMAEACVVPDVIFFRNSMSAIWGDRIQETAIWCDVADERKPRSLVFSFHATPEGILYLFRGTNSVQNPRNIFTILDRIRAEKVVAALSLLHRATENEYRAMNIFNDVSHELRQRLMGILSASAYVSDSLEARNYAPRSETERAKKLFHIRSTVHNIVSMLQRFAYPAPSLIENESQANSFMPYGELVRPVCEMLRMTAKKRGIIFHYVHPNDLGPMYANLEEWRQIIENLVANAVKYTFEGEAVTIRFERGTEGGGKIHFSSRSVEIHPEEVDLIFKLRFRGKAAIDMTTDGQGIGLAVATSVVNRYGARLTLSVTASANTFTIHIPKYLFETAPKGVSSAAALGGL